MDSVIELEHLSKRYGSTVAVEDVSFRVERGEIFGILGPNGSGKTTTVEIVQGLRAADSGMVRVLGMDPRTRGREIRRRVGSQLQSSALPDRMRVWEALALFSSLTPGGLDGRLLLDQWGLAHRAKASFSGLSGGERQRLFVALALVNDPEIVLLDEMTQGLDPAARRVAWDLIRAVRDRGATVVLVTHYMDEAEKLCDRLAVINAGRVVASGTPYDLIAGSGRTMRLRFSAGENDVSWLSRVDHVHEVTQRNGRVVVDGSGPVLAMVASALVDQGIVPEDLEAEHASLEDAYLALTSGAKEGVA
jgi:ABC-2 type transport system ATP-binding protein